MGREIVVGMNARLFPNNWRPAREELAFAAEHGFAFLQFPGPERGLDAERLGDSPEALGAALREAGLGAVMEMLIAVDGEGRTRAGGTPLDVLRANLPAITALGCACVHWHLILSAPEEDATRIEQAVRPLLAEAVALARRGGFRFGLEPNVPSAHPFASVEPARAALQATPGLNLVCDLNHTPAGAEPAYLALAPRISMLHVSDTPLPALNYHWPLGQGTLDLRAWCRGLIDGGFRGPAILEIGGLPHSGGYDQDTDTALIDSRSRLLAAIDG